MTRLTSLMLLLLHFLLHSSSGQEDGLAEYVVSECYGDIFNFDCGPGNKIRINRDFFGYSGKEGCRYRRGDCIISNPKSNSLIHRFCTGQRVCTYYMVERRGCGGYFSNYQQVEYQCIPDTSVTDICSNTEYSASSTYIASPNFPQNYPPNKNCDCVVTAVDSDAKVQMEIVYLAIKYTQPCRDWLSIGRKKTCGTSLDLFQGKSIPIGFHSDGDDSHSGFWLHFQSSKKDGKVVVKCGNVTSAQRSGGSWSPLDAEQDQDVEKQDRTTAPSPGKITGKQADKITDTEGDITADSKEKSNSRERETPSPTSTEITNLKDGDWTDSTESEGANKLQTSPSPVYSTKTNDLNRQNRNELIDTDSEENVRDDESEGLSQSPSSTGTHASPTSPSTASTEDVQVDGRPEGKQGRQPASAVTGSSSPKAPVGPLAPPSTTEWTLPIDKPDKYGVQTSTVPSINLLGGVDPGGRSGMHPGGQSGLDGRAPEAQDTKPGNHNQVSDFLPGFSANNDDLDILNVMEDIENIEKNDMNLNANSREDFNVVNNDEDNKLRSEKSKPAGDEDAESIFDRELVILRTDKTKDNEKETLVSVNDLEVFEVKPTADVSSNVTALPSPGTVETAKEEEHGIITFGLIILCICIGVGIVLVVLVLLIVYCRRRRRCTVNEETQTQGISKHTTSTSISDLDGDSGQGLLTAHNANGNGIVVEVDSLYSHSPPKADKGLQIDLFDDEYDDVIVFEDHSFTGSDCEDLSVCGMPPYQANDKAVQVTSPIKVLDCGPKLRGRPIHRRHVLDTPCSINDEADPECLSQSESDFSGSVAGLCITESDLDACSGSDVDFDTARKESIASMSELAEVTMVPQNALVGIYDPTLEPDWDQRSGISI